MRFFDFRLPSCAIVVGAEIDCRDTAHIWCPSRILEIDDSRAQSRETLIKVRFIGWNEIYDEFIPVNSMRLAPKGLFTSREGGSDLILDLPKYADPGEGTALLTSSIANRRRQPQENSMTLLSNVMESRLYLQRTRNIADRLSIGEQKIYRATSTRLLHG